MDKRDFFRRLKLYFRPVVLLCVIGLCLSACSLGADLNRSTVGTPPGNSLLTDGATTATATTIQARGPSAPLRVYWQQREHFNPLNTFDQTGLAVVKLLHRGLFSLDEDNVLREDLAVSAVWNADNLRYTILLRQDISFQSQQAVKPEDCIQSILTFRENLASYLNTTANPLTTATGEDPGNPSETEESQPVTAPSNETDPSSDPENQPDSPAQTADKTAWQTVFDRLNKITQIERIDDTSFHITLSEADERLLFALTLPIIPAEDVAGTNPNISGTGDFRIENFDAQGTTTLLAVSTESALQTINLIPYSSIDDAMAAYQAGNLDLVLLNEADFTRYRKRNLPQIQMFTGNEYHFLRLGQGNLISQDDFRSLLRQMWILRDDFSSSLASNERVYNLPLPRHDLAWQTFRLLPKNQPITEQEYNLLQRSQDQKLTIITSDQQPQKDWAGILSDRFHEIGLHNEIKVIAAAEYDRALSSGAYDLAFDRITLTQPFEPTGVLRLVAERVQSGAFSLTEEEQQLAQLFLPYWNLPRRLIDEKLVSQNRTAYEKLLHRLSDDLPILGIGFAPCGIFFGPRVDGVLSPREQEPYRGMEDLWIWPSY